MHEKRRYVRMDTVFPVEFEVLTGNGQKNSRALLQGFTRDVSEGGMCIEFKTFAKDAEPALQASDVYLHLTINPTFSLHPIKATASVVWLRQETNAHLTRYWIGVAYRSIDATAQKRIIRHAKRSVWAPRLASAGAILLLIGLAGLWAHNQKLISENRHLIVQLQASAEKKSQVSQDLQGLDEKKKQLDRDLSAARDTIRQMRSSLEVMGRENTAQRTEYEARLQEGQTQQQKIQSELDKVQQGQKDLKDTYRRLEEEGRPQASAGLNQMFQWLKSHQNLRTGLIASFEGDPTLEDTAFTYDQSLAAQVFLLFGDRQNAAQILSFYAKRAQGFGGVFYNAYETAGGRPVESVVHVGPNVWLGIAALQYEHQAKDGAFLPLAKKIGDWVMGLQDDEGGLRGGPDLPWYSTEHNLDAYAFFGLLAQATGEERYRRAQERVLGWIQKYAYSAKEDRMNRGKGDATIATDTFGWAVAAIGPARLKEIQFDPNAILDFAEKNCRVSVDFHPPDGKVTRVQGFDFSKARNLGRGGVISTEWTAQLVVSYQVMARYYRTHEDAEKASDYLQKANFYLNELQKMVITSPSRTGQGRGCLPYASADNVDTGHGWRTPKGASTGSVSATAYGLFAWQGYNPFEWNDKETVNADLS